MNKLVLRNLSIKKNRLLVDVVVGKKVDSLYFEVESNYSNYLSCDNYDAFVVSLIPYAVKHELDILVDGTISSQLFYQLNDYMLPMLCKSFNKKIIKIESDTNDIDYKSSGVGASISCGVDSFYTLLKNQEKKDSKYDITHLTFFNAGSNGEYGGDNARKLFNERLKFIRNFCDTNDYKLVIVDTNINEFMMMNHEKTHTFRTFGCVLALQKLFGKYYFASGLEFDGSHIDEEDTAFYDILNIHLLSNENIKFYCSGIEVSRLDKIKFISKHKITYNWLNVCVCDDYNCGNCEKCMRTMTALDSISMLNKYKKVFDVEKFYGNKNKILVQMLNYNKDPLKKLLYGEIIDEYKNNKTADFNIFIKMRSLLPNKLKLKNIFKIVIGKNNFEKIKGRVKKDNINDGWN